MLELKIESPWDVKSILEFQYFNCPTCPDKYGLKQDFINHATKIHPESIDYLKKISDSRDGSSLFFLARVEPEPIFFGSGQAWATDFVSRAYMSQKNFCSSLLRASKMPMKVEIC